jgi:bifunctional non-homologous end joining protein LigD
LAIVPASVFNVLTWSHDLQTDLKTGRAGRFRYFAFDILYCEGFDLTKVTLLDRKHLLERLLTGLPAGAPIHFSEHLDVDGPTMLAHACRFGLEGIVSKRADLPYRSGRGDHWLKSKCVERQEFVILGYVPSTVTNRSAGSLALGYYGNGDLFYAGRVGTGWSQEEARALRDELEKIKSTKPPFAKPLPSAAEKGVRWAEPRLVCEIEYRGWTRERLLRAAAFKGLGDDKPDDEIVLAASPKRSRPRAPSDRIGVRLTHPEKILWKKRNHQAGTGRVLHRHRRLDPSACRRPAIELGAMSLRHGNQMLFRQTSVARVGQECPPRRYRR